MSARRAVVVAVVVVVIVVVVSDFSWRRCGLHVAVQTLKVTHLNFFVRNEIKCFPLSFLSELISSGYSTNSAH